jgi:hypothetical protein
VYVIKSDATSVRQVKNGLRQLQRFNAPMITTPGRNSARRATDYFAGVVVNQVNVLKAESFGDYGYYGGYREDEEFDTGGKKRRRKQRTKPASL